MRELMKRKTKTSASKLCPCTNSEKQDAFIEFPANESAPQTEINTNDYR